MRWYFRIKTELTGKIEDSFNEYINERWVVAIYAFTRVIKFPGCFSIKYWTDTDRTECRRSYSPRCVCSINSSQYLGKQAWSWAWISSRMALSSNPDFLFSIEFQLAAKYYILINISYRFLTAYGINEYYFTGIWNIHVCMNFLCEIS